MTQPSITDQNGYEAVVAELRRIADALETVPPGFAPAYVSFSIQPGKHNDAASIDAVDAVALAVLGKKGEPQQVDSGRRLHHATGGFRPVNVSVYQQVPGPRDAELEKLRAEVAELKAANARKDEQATDDDSRIVHYLEPGSHGDDDRMACGLRFGDAVKTGAYTGVPGDVTCSGCRPVADEWSE